MAYSIEAEAQAYIEITIYDRFDEATLLGFLNETGSYYCCFYYLVQTAKTVPMTTQIA